VRNWAKVAAEGVKPPPATKTIRTWTSVNGNIHQEYVTGPQERVVVIKLHNSSREDGKAIKSWIQSKMTNNPRALIEHINKAIQRAAEETEDVEMAGTTPTPKPYKHIQAHSAMFLKSGDIQFHTAFATQAKILLAHASEWAKYIGNKAKVVVPTYGVLIHAIPTVSFDPARISAMATQLQTLNAGLIQHDKITYMGWLTKEGAAKTMSSIVVEFTTPEPANRLIHAGCLWSNETHTVEKYDRSCRIKQCLRCYKYGHITTQCAADHDICGYCSDLHDTRKCPVRTTRATPKCANCRQQHASWSNTCEYRKRERQRVTEALKNKTTYWPETSIPATPGPITNTAVATAPLIPLNIAIPDIAVISPTPPDPNDPIPEPKTPQTFGNNTYLNVDFRAPRLNRLQPKPKPKPKPTTKYRARKTLVSKDLDDELANTAPHVSLAEDGPASKKRKRTESTQATLNGLSPGKPSATPGTVRPAPVRKRASTGASTESKRSSRRESVSSAEDTIDVHNSEEDSDSVDLMQIQNPQKDPTENNHSNA
jgi:hypothetical protein